MGPNRTEWKCPNCSQSLGEVFGGELHPADSVLHVRTAGPNLELTCPACGNVKTWYTSDQVVRAVYQLIDAVSTAAARSVINQIGHFVHTELPGIIRQSEKQE